MMSRFSLPPAVVAVAFVFTAGAAQSTTQDHSWVSSTGSGTACTRVSPCGSFQIAHDATGANGVISVLDPGAADISVVTINKSIVIRAEGVDGGNTAANTTPSPWITVAAGPNDVVTLEGLHFNAGSIFFNSGGHLNIVRCVLANLPAAGGVGIKVQPTGASRLSVTDTTIVNMGLGTGGGIVINPQPGGSAQVALKRVTVNSNAFGIAADGSNSTGGINMTIADSLINGNAQDGIIATTTAGHAPIGLMVKNTQSLNNAFGIRSIGPNVTVRVDGATIVGNNTGLSFSGGGALLTFGNNAVRANGSDGAFSGSVGLQ